METVKKKKKKSSTELSPCFLVAGGAPDHGCVHPGRHRQQLQHRTGAFVAILVFYERFILKSNDKVPKKTKKFLGLELVFFLFFLFFCLFKGAICKGRDMTG